jgi:CRP/FNR family transcriptional regulator, cyclic AMP receptor protein
MAEPRSSTLLLRNVPLFASLDDAHCALLAQHVQRRTYPRGATIIEAGEATQSLHLIVTGRAQVVMTDSKGAVVILAILRPGEHFGEMGLLDEHPRSASVVAREPCEVLALGKEQFAACMKDNFELAMTVTRGLVKRLRNADNRIGSLALLDVYGRVAQLLLQESETIDGRRVVVGKYSKQDIARMIGASRERVSRVMTDLQKRGFIEVRRAMIVLRDPIISLTE